MKKRITAALVMAGLLFAFGAHAEENIALPGAREDAAAQQTETAVSSASQEGVVVRERNGVKTATAVNEDGKTVHKAYVAPAEGEMEIVEAYRWFINPYNYVRGRLVRYYDNVYAYNHGDYYLTPFDAHVPQEYLTIDESGMYAVAPIVMDITDAMRVALYGGDYGEVSMVYGQYCERRGDGRGRTGFTGVHEGIDFTYQPEAALFAIMDGEVTRAGDSDGTVGIYNAEYDVTVLYLHCEEILVRRGDLVEAGAYIAQEGKKGSDGTYTHVEMLQGRGTSANPYRNTILESACPYPVMQAALNVTPSGRQPVTAAAVMEAQRMRAEAEAKAKAEAEAAAAQAKAEAEPEIELIDTLGTEQGYGFGAEATVVPEATLPPASK